MPVFFNIYQQRFPKDFKNSYGLKHDLLRIDVDLTLISTQPMYN